MHHHIFISRESLQDHSFFFFVLTMNSFAALGFLYHRGAFDRCHIPIRATICQGNENVNRKEFFIVLLQGTVDHRGRFIKANIGQIGKNHDTYFWGILFVHRHGCGGSLC